MPPIESLRACFPRIICGRSTSTGTFTPAAAAFKRPEGLHRRAGRRYGKAASAEDFTYKSQLMAYEGVRAMFEAYSRNKYTSTGVIQWMLNNAWPSMIWHLYDYYLRPGGGYFGAKIAMQALDPVYGYDDHSVWLVSSQYEDAKGLKLTARILNIDATEKFSKRSRSMFQRTAGKVLALPQVDGLSPAFFLDLRVYRFERQAGRDQTSIGSPRKTKPSIGPSRIGTSLPPRHIRTTPRSQLAESKAQRFQPLRKQRKSIRDARHA